MINSLNQTIQKARSTPIDQSRLSVLDQLTHYIQQKVDQGLPVQLNFICTHNSRRSQLSQIWAKTAAVYFDIKIDTYSGGVEVTAFNHRAVASCQRLGFNIQKTNDSQNPEYKVLFSNDTPPLLTFSKLYDHAENPDKGFAAIMTCSDADENCPFIPGAEIRIPLRYLDPKAFDDTPLEQQKYDERSLQIASEMFYIFNKIKQ